VGAAEGTIIATIITIHIGTSHPSSGAPASPGIGIAIAIAACGDITRPRWMMYPQASAVRPASPAATTTRSRRRALWSRPGPAVAVFMEIRRYCWLVQVGVERRWNSSQRPLPGCRLDS
jgi:hypothetical protein